MCVKDVFTREHSQDLNTAICEHLVRQGKLDVGERLVEVSRVDVHSWVHVHMGS